MECGKIVNGDDTTAHWGPPGEAANPGHLIAVAEVLVELSDEIEALGAQLCMDPTILARHLAPLQAIDLIAQKQRWLATLLLADCPVSAVASIAVDALRDRLAPVCQQGR